MSETQDKFAEFGTHASFAHRRYYYESGSSTEVAFHLLDGEKIHLSEEYIGDSDTEEHTLTSYLFESGVLSVYRSTTIKDYEGAREKFFEAHAIGTEDFRPQWTIDRDDTREHPIEATTDIAGVDG